MRSASEQPARAMAGTEPRDERELRVWTPIAMWLAGSATIAVATVLPGGGALHVERLRGLAGAGLCAAAFTFAMFPRVSNRALYVLTNIFTVLGSISVWLACLWSGGASSGFIEMYFFPVLYAAYFFRSRQAIGQLVLVTALAASPELYGASLRGAQFPGHLLVLLAALWGMAVVVGLRKRRLLLAELRSREQALSDPLTGLHNLRSLRERASSHPPAQGTAVLIIDIDDFKSVNTARGHTGADELLRAVAVELLEWSTDGDCVARIGGDEFAVLVSRGGKADVQALAAGCGEAVQIAAARMGITERAVSGSVGHAMWPEDGLTLSELLRVADRRMFSAKASKRKAADAPAGRTSTAAAASDQDPTTPNVPVVAGPRLKLVASAPSAMGEAPRASQAHETARVRKTPLARLRSLPLQAAVATALWVGGAALTSIVMLLPGADRAHLSLALVLLACSAAVGVLIPAVGVLLGEVAYVTSDALAVLAIAVGVYLTGATASPLLPLVFVAVAFAAFFYTPRAATLRLGGAVAVCASPFLYATDDARLQFIVPFVALTTTAGVLACIILYNKRELAQAAHVAREMAAHDPLTGLPNRRAFHNGVSRALELARKRATPLSLSVAMIDLDNFKRVNDTFGHAAGDLVLLAIARALNVATRPGDLVARIGGDEFALLARGVDASASHALGVRCVRAVEAAVRRAGYADCGVSATVGYALFPFHGTTLDMLLDAADSALMDAKAKGKRRVSGAAEAPNAQLDAS
jgi:diguanylate cyclase (GGDEF)-like protein